MGDSVDAAFCRFAAEARPGLLRTALLLAGDPADAEELVQVGLLRSLRRWSRITADGQPADAVVAELLALASRRRPPRARGGFAEPRPLLPEVTRAIGLALGQMPPRTRAVVVLRLHDDRSVPATARLLGIPAATVAALEVEGTALLVAAGGEAELAEHLETLADLPPGQQPDPDTAVADVLARRRRTRWLAVAAVVGLVFALAVVVPRAAETLRALPAVARDAATQHSASSLSTAAVLVGPSRGPLARDPEMVAQFRERDWGPVVAPDPSQRTLVFATYTPSGRVALVVGDVGKDFHGVWLTGPAGTPPAALQVHVPAVLGRNRPAALVVGRPPLGSLVVVAAPGDHIEVSDRLMVTVRGTMSRDYEPVDDMDGVAVVPVRVTSAGVAASVRVLRQGRVVYRSGVELADPVAADAPSLLPREALRPSTVAPYPSLVTEALDETAMPLGVEPRDLEPQLLWSGAPIGGRGMVAAVVVAHSPGAGLVVSTWAGRPTDGVPCGTQTLPGRFDVTQLNIARVCDLTAAGGGRWLVVSVAPEADTAVVLDHHGNVLTSLALQEGAAVVPLPRGAARVLVRTTVSRSPVEIPLAPKPNAPFGDYGATP